MTVWRRAAPVPRDIAALAAALMVGAALALLPAWLGGALLALAAVVLLTLIDPLVGLAATLVLAPFGAFENRVLGPGPLDSGQLLLLFTVGAWLASGVRRQALRLPRAALHPYLIPFLGVAMVSLLAAPAIAAGWRELLKWVEIALLMSLAVDLLDRSPLLAARLPATSPWRGRLLLGLLLLAGLSQALGGIWQAVLRGTGPEHFLVGGRFYRPYGTFDQPNPYGGFVGMNACLAWGALLGLARCRAWRTWPDRLWLLSLLAVAGTTTAALVLSWSRGAWLGFAGGVAVILLFWPRRRWIGGAVLAAGLVVGGVALAAGLVPAGVRDRLTSITAEFRLGDVRGVDINDENYAVLERLAHWQAAIAMADDHPWLGVGFGNYEAAYADYALINWPFPLGHAHNYYLNLLAEVGLVGIIAYLVFWGAVVCQSLRLLRRLEDPARGIALGALGVWAALTVHHLVDKLYVNNVYIYLGVLLGLQQWLDRDESM